LEACQEFIGVDEVYNINVPNLTLRMIAKCLSRFEELQSVVKTISDKENLAKKVKLLQKKREWAAVAELKEQCEVNAMKVLQMFNASTIRSSHFC
jgi:hypothetical protein